MKKMKKAHKRAIMSFLLPITILYSTIGYTQSPFAYNLEELYDFKAKSIYGLYQAKDKTMWIATDQGLFSFNGTAFKKYINPKVKNEFHNIREDKDGRIWCSNFAGQLFYIEDGILTFFQDVNSYAINGIISYNVAYFPKIYIGTSYGFFITDFHNREQTKHFQPRIYNKAHYKILPNNDTIYSHSIINIQPYKGGLIYAHGNLKKEFLLYTLYKNKVQTLFTFPKKRGKLHLFSLISHNDSIVSVWNTPDKKPQIYRYHDQSLETITYNDLPAPVKTVFYHDSQLQKYWMGTYSGVVVLDISLKPEEEYFHFLKGHAISGVVRDHEGNYWISTLHSGIYIVPSLQIQTFNKSNSSLIKDEITSMVKRGQGRLLLLDNLGNLYEYHTKKNKLTRKFNIGVYIGNMVYNPIKGHVYIHGAKYAYNPLNGKLELPNILRIKKGTAIDNTHFLVSTSRNAHITNFETDPAKRPMPPAWEKQRRSINSDILGDQSPFNKIILRGMRSYTNTICGDTGTLYVSYSDGLFAYDSHINEYPVTYKDRPLIITAIHSDTDKGVWAADTEGSLFYIYKDSLSHVASFDGEIRHINKSGTTLYLGSDHGLYTYDLKTGEKDVINTLDGLPSNAITGLAVVDNTIFVSTLKGLVKIPLDYRHKNTIPPEVELTGISVNNNTYPLGETLKLSHRQNTIRFTYNTFAFRSQKTFTYAYRMLGIDSTWTFSKSNYANFPALVPNNYTFEVKAINEDGTESTQIQQISFLIDSPFYQKWWFYLLITLVSSVSVWGFSRYRIRAIKKQNHLEQQKKALERQLATSAMTTLKAQMNPHFMFNAMTAIQSLILQGEQDEAYNYLTKFSTLIRENLNMSEQYFVYFDREMALIKTYLQLEKLRFDKDFEYHIEGVGSVGDVKIPAMIIQPFVENAVKHGLLHKKGPKKLYLVFKQEEVLHCTITDNGIGRKASRIINAENNGGHIPFATGAIEKRLTLLRDYYKLNLGVHYIDLEENNSAKGTKVTLKIPYTSDE